MGRRLMIEDYVRNARLVRVVDGDTCILDIDLGFRIWMTVKVRVLGINCPECKGLTKGAGDTAARFTSQWFFERPEFQVKTYLDKLDSFGRVLAEIRCEDESLAEQQIASGNAVAYRSAW